MKGKIIVITGIDGSGKEEQSKRLCAYLQSCGINATRQSFPNYDSESSGPVKMYLDKNICANANDLNPYQATNLFLTDFICTMKNYEKFLDSGGVLILDRYVESNYIHQACKFSNEIDKIRFINTVKTYAFNILKLPAPNLVIYLDTPLEICKQNIAARNEKNTQLKNGAKQDIHEQDKRHLENAYNMAQMVSNHEKWTKIRCVDENGKQRSISSIHNNIKNIVDKFLDKKHTQEL